VSTRTVLSTATAWRVVGVGAASGGAAGTQATTAAAGLPCSVSSRASNSSSSIALLTAGVAASGAGSTVPGTALPYIPSSNASNSSSSIGAPSTAGATGDGAA